MKRKIANDAAEAANRFIKSVQAAFDADQKAKDERKETNTRRLEYFDSPSKEVAAMKRASLDLTRALANMRKREQ